MKYYELTFLSDKNITEEIVSYTQGEGGIVQESQALTRREGGTINFYFDADKIVNLQNWLRANSQILRFMILAKRLRKTEIKPRRHSLRPSPEKQKKVEIKEIEKKLEEILGE